MTTRSSAKRFAKPRSSSSAFGRGWRERHLPDSPDLRYTPTIAFSSHHTSNLPGVPRLAPRRQQGRRLQPAGGDFLHPQPRVAHRVHRRHLPADAHGEVRKRRIRRTPHAGMCFNTALVPPTCPIDVRCSSDALRFRLPSTSLMADNRLPTAAVLPSHLISGVERQLRRGHHGTAPPPRRDDLGSRLPHR